MKSQNENNNFKLFLSLFPRIFEEQLNGEELTFTRRVKNVWMLLGGKKKERKTRDARECSRTLQMTVSRAEGRHGGQDSAVSVSRGAECRRQRIIHPFLPPSLCRDAPHMSSLGYHACCCARPYYSRNIIFQVAWSTRSTSCELIFELNHLKGESRVSRQMCETLYGLRLVRRKKE